MATVDDLKVMLEQQAAAQRAEIERNAEWRGKFGGLVERVANEVQIVTKRVEKLEAEHVLQSRRVRAVADSSADLEGRVMRKLADQDKELDTVKTDVAIVKAETRTQTTILTKTQEMAAATHTHVTELLGGLKFAKWALPGVWAFTIALLVAAWWLFGRTQLPLAH